MQCSFVQSSLTVVYGLLVGLAGYSVILYPSVPSYAVSQIGADVVVIQVKSYVSVKVPVVEVSRVAFVCTPDLL